MKQPEITIRRFAVDDYDEVKRLNDLVFAPLGIHGYSADRFKDLDDIYTNYYDNNGEFLLVVSNSKLIGMGGLYRYDINTCKLKRMRIHPDYQRSGLGKRILIRLEQFARETNYIRIVLRTSPKLESACLFYEKNGYSRIANPDGDNLSWYEKILEPYQSA